MQPLNQSQQAAPAAAPPASRMTLAGVTKGRIKRPRRLLVYGVEGVGKSTFAACAPSPVFLGAEDGTSELDVERLPEPATWQDILDGIELVRANAADRGWKTLAVDTLDWAEPLCWRHACKAAGKASIEDFDFGKGYLAAFDLWRDFIARLDRLRAERGTEIILLAHAHAKAFKDPALDSYDRWAMKLHSKAAGLLKEWADALLFAREEVLTTQDKTGRVRGVSGKDDPHYLYTQRRPAWDAKNRFGLPPRIDLSWEAFVEGVERGMPAEPPKLRVLIEELLPRLGDKRAAAEKALASAGSNSTKLARILEHAREVADQQSNAEKEKSQ